MRIITIPRYPLNRLGFALMAILMCWLVVANSAFAQNGNGQISERILSAEIERVKQIPDLAEDEKSRILENLTNAAEQLKQAEGYRIQAERFKNERSTAQKDIERLDKELNELRKLFEKTSGADRRDYSKLSLSELEAKLSSEQAELVQLQNQVADNKKILQDLDNRPSAATEELAEVSKRTNEISASLDAAANEEQSDLTKSRVLFDQARLKAYQAQKTMLEQEIPGIPKRREYISKLLSKLAVEILIKQRTVTDLRLLTGDARTGIAEQIYNDAQNFTKAVADRHPLVQAYALENEALGAKLLKIVVSGETLPQDEARISAMISQVEDDQSLAARILDTGKASRSYGDHLRKLRKKQPRIRTLKAEIKARDSELEDALYERIVNEEQLQTFNTTPLDIDAMVGKAGPDIAPLSDADRQALRNLHDHRRQLLNNINSFSDLRATKLEEVNSLEKQLLNKVVNLCALLDGRLLWLPSTERVGLNWPAKLVGEMGAALANLDISKTVSELVNGVKQSWFFLFIFLGLLAGTILLQHRIAPVVDHLSARVGRVQKDAYWLTPLAVLDGFLRAIPIAAIPLIIGFALENAKGGLQITGPYLKASAQLSGFIFVLLSLYEWSRKKGLFQVHFRVDLELRNRIRTYMPVLVVLQTISFLILDWARKKLEYGEDYAALAIFAFLIGSLSISYFTFRIAWKRSPVQKHYRGETEGFYLRYEKWFFFIAIAFPLMTAVIAMFGYLDTASLLLSRFFWSFCVLLGAYILHGLLRRTVVIAQRRLALEQARARRDANVKARQEKVAAEERGEITVPKIDTESIDLETINRQSSQLVNVMVFIVTVLFLWSLWSNLLPALSVFDSVELWEYTDRSGARSAITLWNAMQALAIGIITWLSARNLPGFMEIFILKRLNMAQSSRFAVVTVLGYVIFILGVVVAFNKLGTQWSQLQWIVAALGVGIGFGLQAIFANLISGLIILFERPVRIGDYITIGEISGTVTRIQIRATTLLDLDNKEILIPNQEIISARVTNWTLSNSVTRLIINVGIAYGSDTKKAHEIMMEVVKANPNVLNVPEPTVLFLGFGASSLDFEVRVFLRDFVRRFRVSHELHMALDEALGDADITIAFPQLDVHVKDTETPPTLLSVPKKRSKKS